MIRRLLNWIEWNGIALVMCILFVIMIIAWLSGSPGYSPQYGGTK